MSELHCGGTLGGLIAARWRGLVTRRRSPQVRWSYRQLGDAVGRFISLLRAVGLTKGEAISVLSSNRAESWAAISAAMVMGRVIHRCIRWPPKMITLSLSRMPRLTR